MAQLLSWTADLSVGIDAIDDQHKRIVHYINQLHEARLTQDRNDVAAVIEGLVDYTLSHFRFEEAMLQKALYPMLPVHKKVHRLFIRRISDYQQRFALGNDVAEELLITLVKWLGNHIKCEDMDYSPIVRARISEADLRQLKKGKSDSPQRP
ncbi:MAG: bacteriohemerythrin [Sulfuritalea sp.]|jgi:hemerythrin|nr:bacteriohemerythrin [Sulfuritalea sp.]